MPNFVYNNTSLPFPKTDKAPIPAGEDPTKWVDMVDWNAVCQALTDVQGFCRGAIWDGFVAQASDPAPAGVGAYMWVSSATGALMLNTGSGSKQLLSVTVLRQVNYTITGTEANAGLDFFVPVNPSAGTASYGVWLAPAGITNAPVYDLPNGVGDRSATQFRLTLAAAMTVGDKLSFLIFAP